MRLSKVYIFLWELFILAIIHQFKYVFAYPVTQ